MDEHSKPTSLRLTGTLVSAEQISGVDLVINVSEVAVPTVGDDHGCTGLETGKVMGDFAALEVGLQLFFSGIIPLSSMGEWALTVGKFLPLTYSGDAISQIILYGHNLGDILLNLGVLMIFLIILTILNIVGLRRYRKV